MVGGNIYQYMDPVGTVLLVGAAYLLLWVISSYLIRRVTDDETDDDRFPTAARRVSDSPTYRTEGDSAGDAATTVVCPACGAENARDYTFCRQCVADLSTAANRRSPGRAH